MSELTARANGRRYALELTLVMVIYAASVVGAPFLIKAFKAQGPMLYAIALLPAIPFFLVSVVMGRYLAGADEFVRTRLAKSMLLGAAITLGIVTAWDFLRVYANAPGIPPFIIGPGFFAAMGLAQVLLSIFDPIRGDDA